MLGECRYRYFMTGEFGVEEDEKNDLLTAVIAAVVSMCVTHMCCLSAGMTGNFWGPGPVGGPS